MAPHGLFEAVVRCLSSHPLHLSCLSGAVSLLRLMATLRALSIVFTKPLSLAILLLLYAVERQQWEETALCPKESATSALRVSKTLAQGRLGWADIVFSLHQIGGYRASEKTVTRALKQLEKAELVDCHIEQELPRRCSYALTPRAEPLCLFLHLMLWSQSSVAPALPPDRAS